MERVTREGGDGADVIKLKASPAGARERKQSAVRCPRRRFALSSSFAMEQSFNREQIRKFEPDECSV